MKRQRGFSLLELLIVIAILGIIATLAIPGLFKAKQNARAGSAIQSLRMITTAQHLYERRRKVYATLDQLNPEGTIDTVLVSGQKSGYSFVVTLSDDAKSFEATATPLDKPDEFEHFYVDLTGVIRVNHGAPATADSEPIPK